MTTKTTKKVRKKVTKNVADNGGKVILTVNQATGLRNKLLKANVSIPKFLNAKLGLV